MPSSRSDAIRSRLIRQLDPYGAEGTRTDLAGIIDLEALENERYQDVLDAVEARLSLARYSLISMLIAGIYFGLLVGLWLMDFSSWWSVMQWSIPALLVTIYGGYSTHQTVLQIRQLSEARALLVLLADPPPEEA